MEKSKLQLTSETNTDFWNDSCSVEELKYAIENGAVGATANPVIIGEVLKKEMHLWEDKIYQIIDEMPSATEDLFLAPNCWNQYFMIKRGKMGDCHFRPIPNITEMLEK